MPDCRSDKGDLKSDLFSQEHPINDEEAFTSTKGCVFDVATLRDHYDNYKPAPYVGSVTKDGLNLNDNGMLHCFERPKSGTPYVIGADVGEGLEHGDRSAAIVLNAHTGEQVAEWHGLIHPDDFGEELIHLGMYYNKAVLAVERNNHGFTTLTHLHENRYPNIYTEKNIAKGYEKETSRLGFLTTARTRPMMIDAFRTLLKDGLVLRSKKWISECMNFVHNPRTGKMEAEQGAHDDLVIAGCIACYVYSDARAPKVPEQEPSKFSPRWFRNRQKQRDGLRYNVGSFQKYS